MKQIGRNDPCPCGSGKKYKQCCGQDGRTAVAARPDPDPASIDEAFRSALNHYRAGRLGQAEALYRQILHAAPDHPDALHLLGLVVHQGGQNDAALELINRAIAANPLHPVYHNNCGIVLHAQGRIDQAIACYRKALSLRPEYPEALNSLGNALKDLGRPDEAVASYRQALRFRPAYAEARINLGNVLRDLGELGEAIACYREALAYGSHAAQAHYNLGNALRDRGELNEAAASYRNALSSNPDFADAHNNLGLVRHEQGKLVEALRSYADALSILPHHAAYHYNMGNGLKDLGELTEAVASYRRALSFEPDYADAHLNLGIAQQAQGNLREAAECYRRTLTLRPDYAEAHNNLGDAQSELGDADAALASYRRALELREAPEFKSSFVRCIVNGDVRLDADARRLVVRALSEPWARPSDLAKASIRLIGLDPDIRDCIERSSNAWPTRLTRQALLGPRGIAGLAADPLLRALLENAQVCELAMERFLTMVRHAILDAASEEVSADAGLQDLAFCCALARQCFINDFIFSQTDEELGRAKMLREKLVAALHLGGPVPPLWIAAVAAYFPLSSLPSAQALLARSWPDSINALLQQQVAEPLEEREYRSRIPALTSIDDGVSRLVRQQYEENPYPRWIKLPALRKSQTIDSRLRKLFPFAPLGLASERGDIDILIAGCGTGQESIEIAQEFPASRVLAVDLSVASLCYAKRKASELRQGNIEYAQADIMKLGSIGRTFDAIASVGVLHHLADPMAGWRELLSLLRPGGFMLIGLYSEQGRRAIVAARDFIAERGYSADAADIRRCRQDLMSVSDGRTFGPLALLRDFYATGDCRDLLFHVQEHRFALPRIKEMIGSLGLNFIGFLQAPHVLNAYAERFPEDKARTSLDHWDRFEADFPDTFAGMYVFWVQKAGAELLRTAA